MIAFLIFYQSFRDVRKNEKRMIQGNPYQQLVRDANGGQSQRVPVFCVRAVCAHHALYRVVADRGDRLDFFYQLRPVSPIEIQLDRSRQLQAIFLGQGIAGGPFWLITGWTLIWTLVATSLAIFIGFALALLVNQDRVYGKRFFRTIYLLPWAVPAFNHNHVLFDHVLT